jgi:phage replication-related protein YjqB (UPF0714/DUF867 family)
MATGKLTSPEQLMANSAKVGADFTCRRIAEQSMDGKNHPLVLALKAGDVHPGTDVIARKIAEKVRANLYMFSVSNKNGQKYRRPDLDLSSNGWTEKVLEEMLETANLVLSVIATKGNSQKEGGMNPVTMVGGMNASFRAKVEAELREQYFVVEKPAKKVTGIAPNNVANRGLGENGGAQLAIRRSQLDALLGDEALLEAYTQAVANAILQQQAKIQN